MPCMIIGSLTTLKTSAPLAEGLAQLWEHPQVRRELVRASRPAPWRVDHLHAPLDIANVPLAVHATQAEILAAFDIGSGVSRPPGSRESGGTRTTRPTCSHCRSTSRRARSRRTTRYRDYAISPELIHWESQSATSLESDSGRRYISQAENGTNVALFRG